MIQSQTEVKLAISSSTAPCLRWGHIRSGACAAVLFTAVCPAQDSRPAGGAFRPDQATAVTPVNRLPDARARMEWQDRKARERQFALANTARKRQMSDDAALLSALVAQFNHDLDAKTEPDSPLLIHNLETIEKLAHAIKEKMKLTVAAS
jgi:hypothetical protein